MAAPPSSAPAPSSPGASTTGQRRLQLTTCLGEGGFGEVYLADLLTGSGLRRQVAVKLLRDQVFLSHQAVLRLRDEAKLLAALNHRAILVVFDLVEVEGRLAMVTEYLPGQDLADVIDAGQTLPVRVALEVVSEVAGALDAAWRTPAPDSDQPLALVHRDIKPSNIRLGASGGVKLLDFGIARSDEVEREAYTGTGRMVGTLAYLAPERVTSDQADPGCDVFSLGCVLYEALAGARLYKGVTQRQLTLQALDADSHGAFVEERCGQLAAAPPPQVLALLRSMLAHEPGDRPSAATIEHQADELAQSADGPHLRRWARGRTWPAPTEIRGALAGRILAVSDAIRSTGSPGAPTAPAGVVAPPTDPYGTLEPPVSGPVSSGAAPTAVAAQTQHSSLLTQGPPSPPPGSGAADRRPLMWGALLALGLVVAGLVLKPWEGPAVPSDDVLSVDQAVPAQAVPAQAVPAQAVPAQAVPAQAVPAEAVPSHAQAGETQVEAPVESAPVEPDAAQAPAADAPAAEPVPRLAPDPTPPVATVPAAASPAAASPAAASPAAASPAAASPAAPPAMGTVAVKATVPVRLSGPDGQHPPGAVPVGRYDLQANFGDGFRTYTTFSVADGQTVALTCSHLVLTCLIDG